MNLLRITPANTIWAGLVSLAVMSVTSSSLAVTVEQVPNPREVNGGWVTDMAEMLTPATETQLNQIISQLEAKNGSEIAVVTVPETTASTPKEFATKLLNYWGIGKTDKNNGVLFLISKGERRTEIETGSGIQGILSNAKVRDIINTQITPKFKQGDFNGGTLAGTKAVVIALETPQVTSTVRDPNKPQPVATLPPAIVEQYEDNNLPWWLLGGAGLALAIGVAAFKPRRGKITPAKRSHLLPQKNVFHGANNKQRTQKVESEGVEYRSSDSFSDSSSYTSSSDYGSSYSGGDSGGGSFGGGSSDGGGAGGSW
ncbi:MAG: TPM domain-containing protein [Nostocaceae cyanobacterium]|nr:TPM domain-containing protein [Nostocaceae cyanobacterium]